MKVPLALRIAYLLCAVMLPAVVQAQFNYVGNDNNTITITGYIGDGGSVSIPSTIDGMSVTSIGDNAFYGCNGLTSVAIPNSVTSIGDYAFSDCGSLTVVFFQGNTPSVGLDVFDGDNNVIVYYLLGSTGWGSTFGGCPTLPGYPPAPYTYTINSSTITITGYFGDGGAVSIPGSILVTGVNLPVTSIGDDAFYGCVELTSVVIPNSVASIGNGAFIWCRLTNVMILNGVANIGDGAFSHCSVLTHIMIPNSVTNIGVTAFANCYSLTSVTIGNNVNNLGGRSVLFLLQP